MSSALKYLNSTIGRKYLMSLSGIAWSLFVLSHMLGNLLIFVGAEAYNKYSHALISNPFLVVAEGGLVVFLLTHIYTGLKLTFRNWNSKPIKYAVTPKGPKGASRAASTMIYTGSMTLIFLIYHLITFKYGPHYSVNYNGVEMRDIHRLIIEVFQSPFYVAWYLICLILLGFHLFHGFKSSFASLGINHPRYNSFIKCFGQAYAVIVVAGFLAQPLYVFFSR